jgi:hypothetical protein
MENRLIKFLLVILFLFICSRMIFSNKNKLVAEAEKGIIIELQGYFTGDIEGDIEKIILYNDYTFASELKTSYFNAVITGSYTLDDKNFFSFEGYGEALGPEQDVDITTSKFSLFGKGVLNLEQGSGKGSLLFIFDDWNEKDHSDYYLFLYNNSDK